MSPGAVMWINLRFWLLALLLAVSSPVVLADDLYLICHPGLALAPADVRDMFLGEKQYLNSVRLVPVDNAAAQAMFFEKVLKMNDVRYANTWARKSFRDGINPPATMANDGAVVEFVKRTPGACGYLIRAPDEGVALIGRY